MKWQRVQGSRNVEGLRECEALRELSPQKHFRTLDGMVSQAAALVSSKNIFELSCDSQSIYSCRCFPQAKDGFLLGQKRNHRGSKEVDGDLDRE